MKRLLFLLLTVHWSLVTPATAQTPALINYQGRLLDGTNLVNGTVSMDLTLYNSASGGGFQYVDTGSVVVVDGLYSTFLGDGTALGSLTNALAQTNVYLEITVNGTTLSPRERLVSAAYAMRSTRADIFTGAVSDSQLSTNISRLNSTNQIFSGPVIFNSISNTFIGTFTGMFAGNGASVTNLQLTSLTDPGVFSWGGHFVVAASPSVNSNPENVAAADVNGDGWVDVISANLLSDTLSVLTNNGAGIFTLSASPAVGNHPIFVLAADVTADGKVDLISANLGSNTLSVLTNNGSGGFALATSPTVGNGPYGVAAADVNGDGRIDLISANSGGAGTLTVLTNNGAGGFVLSSSPVVGGSPRSVVAVDVNGDGYVDLISANFTSNSLSVLTNNGSGGFTLASSPHVGNSPISLAAADVNGDGRIDLISANFGSDTLSVLTNNGAGGFVLSSSPGVGGFPRNVLAADVNADGKVDLISANNADSTLSVLTNNGSGAFTLCSSPAVGDHPTSVASLDINGDGMIDLVSANGNDGTLSLLLNTPIMYGVFQGDGSGLYNAAGWVRNGADISYTNGNVGIGTTSPTNKLHVAGTVQALAYITGSDRNLKENIQPVAADDILAKVSSLPIATWNFKNDASGTHLGPMAQDFRAAFGLGNTDSGIFTVDADGVALAAIQALAAENAELKSQVNELKARLDAIEGK